tara:strand:- start:112 stop:858 length:747 start_codon:yes stop_codon:yes gene_type:complete
MESNISQIFLTQVSQELPKFLKRTTSSIKKYFNDHKITIYTNDSLYSFIKDNYDKEVITAYEKLNPLAYKADLGRYCLLYLKGGWYFDIAIECLKGYTIKKDTDLLCFRDEQRHSKTSWAVCNGLFWTKKKNKIMSRCIEKIIENCKSNWYGRTPLCPTGPSLLGESIVFENRKQNILFGDLIRPNIPFTRKNFPFFRKIFKAKFYLPNSESFALLKPARGGNLTSIGVKSSNNYNDYWHSQTVYNKW